ncbi:hypothetical protein A0H81_08357 [Grifola frondosa]|uniref:Uncharacterized protein n=1 Tax=Grifola frondosa TaxID=5627 RepID=A0A1C7M339_GRIFR|nr:hypothetical protein A0H81_08357 [Grifola frondosa]
MSSSWSEDDWERSSERLSRSLLGRVSSCGSSIDPSWQGGWAVEDWLSAASSFHAHERYSGQEEIGRASIE